jgi:membrane protease YdiL (CAAX protease family)
MSEQIPRPFDDNSDDNTNQHDPTKMNRPASEHEEHNSHAASDVTAHHVPEANPNALSSDNHSSDILPKESSTLTVAPVKPFAHAQYGYAAVLCIFLMYQFAGGALHSALRSVQSGAVAAVLQGLGQAMFMLIPALFVMRYSPLKTDGLMRLGGQVTGFQWILGLLGIFGVQLFDAGFVVMQERLIPTALQPAFQQLRQWSNLVEQAYRDLFAGTTAMEAVRALLVGAVVPAFAEEILFRGVFQRSLEEVRSPRRAITITALFFGLLHFNPMSFVPLVAIGLYLGFLAYYTQSLALPIVAHFLSNAIAIVALYAPKQDGELPPESLPLSQAFLLAFLGIVILGGAFLTMLRHTPQVTPKPHVPSHPTLSEV